MDKAALDLLANYSWPGNDAQLDNVLRQLVLFCSSKSITYEEVTNIIFEQSNEIPLDEAITKPIGDGFNLKEHLKDETKKYIIKAKMKFKGNMAQMARSLGFDNYQTLAARMKSLDIKMDK